LNDKNINTPSEVLSSTGRISRNANILSINKEDLKEASVKTPSAYTLRTRMGFASVDPSRR